MENPMCPNIEEARLNRERVKEGYCNTFYDQQANIEAQWAYGALPPRSLVIGALPVVCLKQIRLDRDQRLVVK